ncbi:hypothetical protein [Winogradskyella forsetii]|uniref:hypothetical protein n=1 Tax=Winogradskyella forsetii TaxID=2686077 RepID=UPI0015B8520A|nr:hypothetical protein [Winogradskyella forsetii]
MQRYNFTNPLFLLKIEAMIRRFYILFCLVFMVACDDGDILTVELEFDEELEICDNFVASYLIYNTKSDPNESLTLLLPKPEYEDLFLFPTPEGDPEIIQLSDSDVQFNYRSYNINPNALLCDVITNSELVITEDYPADAGTAEVTVTVLDDDNDGVPNEFEGISGDQYEDGIYWDSQDWDDDGIPDYLDEDDDNDNVLTKFELNDEDDDDDDPTTNPLNSDADVPITGDNFPDYLDDDDDGDGIPTYLEDVDGDKNPRSGSVDQVVDVEGISVYRYLYNHEDYMDPYPDPGKRITTFSRVVTTTFVVRDIDLEVLRTTFISLGTLGTSLTITPAVFDQDED